MPGRLPTPEADWKPIMATVMDWRRTWDTWFGDDFEGGLARYVITFSYGIAGKTYTGSYEAGSPKEVGETFEILFDPENPERNTGSDPKQKLWVRALAIALGTGIVFLLIKLLPASAW